MVDGRPEGTGRALPFPLLLPFALLLAACRRLVALRASAAPVALVVTCGAASSTPGGMMKVLVLLPQPAHAVHSVHSPLQRLPAEVKQISTVATRGPVRMLPPPAEAS